jgi:[ribosomal protein S18]-alanine N-acetyltransferase
MGADVKREKAMVAIRTLLPSDSPAVTKILREAPEAANWSGESFEESLAGSGVVALAGETDGKLSGFLFGRQVGCEAEVLNLAVTPSRRRIGAGGALLRSALEEWQSRGVSRVFLEVRESNTAAIALYAKHGFAGTGRRPAYYHDPAEAAVLMEKKLTG